MADARDTDLLTGDQAIADHLGWSLKATQHRREAGEIPTFRIGRTVCALRSKLDAHMQGLHARAEAERQRVLRGARAE